MMRVLAVLLFFVMTTMPALAQEAQDLIGRWKIISLDEERPEFSGEISIYQGDSGKLEGELVAQDAYAGNFGRALQGCSVTVSGEYVFVYSFIKEMLVWEVPNPPFGYVPDHFRMTWESEDALVGLVNGRLSVRWERIDPGLV